MPSGTPETLDLLEFVFGTIAVFKEVTAEDSPGGKKIDPFREGYKFLGLAGPAMSAFGGIDKIPGELKDIDPQEQQRIIDHFTRGAEELGIGSDLVQARIICGLKSVQGQPLSLLIQLFDKNPDIRQEALAKMRELDWL